MKLVTSLFISLAVGGADAAFAPSNHLKFSRAQQTIRVTHLGQDPSGTSEKGSPFDMSKFSMPDLPDLPDLSSFSLPTIDTSGIKDSISRALDFENFDGRMVLDNILQSDQEFGARGEVLFITQAVLLVSILIGGLPFLGETLHFLAGPGLFLGGLGLAAVGLADLGSDSLSPFPQPTETATLKTEGAYGQMRHPMYAGLLALALGFSIMTDSADRVLLVLGLWYLLEIKSTVEEEMMIDKFGTDYEIYMAEVDTKFFPKAALDQLPWNKEE